MYALTQWPRSHQECKDQTKSYDAKVLKQPLDPKKSHEPKFKDTYIKLFPPGDNSPPTRFYGLPKIHKANIPFRPIVSACGTSTYKLAKSLTRIIQQYCGNNFSFIKDSKGLAKGLRDIKVAPDETLVSFNVRAFFTSILVPVTLEVTNRKFTEHMSQEQMENFLEVLPFGIST